MAENINPVELDADELSEEALSAVRGGVDPKLLSKTRPVGSSCICSKCKQQFASELELKLHKCDVNIANA